MSTPALVLVVDDYLLFREVIAQSLVSANYRVLKASNGEDAIRIAREKHPDLILLDVNMPGMDGFQTAGVLRKDPATKDIPILLLTGEATGVESIEEGFELGAEDYMTKGQSTREIILRIEHVLRQHRQPET